MAQQLYYLAAFMLILIASTAYYIAASILAPRPRRQGEATLPYACGEKGQEAKSLDPPYPLVLIVFAIAESVPIASFFCVTQDRLALLPLLVAAFAPPLLAAGRRHERS